MWYKTTGLDSFKTKKINVMGEEKVEGLFWVKRKLIKHNKNNR